MTETYLTCLLRRIARYTAATVAVAYAVYKLRHVEVEERRGKGEQSQHGEDLLDNMEATLLLQVPIGLPHPQPRTYYKGSDPEWQAFKRIAQDKAAERRIHRKGDPSTYAKGSQEHC